MVAASESERTRLIDAGPLLPLYIGLSVPRWARPVMGRDAWKEELPHVS
jgi:hypothetical protein